MLVVQLMVAELEVIPVTVTAEMTQGAVPDVVNVKFVEVAVPRAGVVTVAGRRGVAPLVVEQVAVAPGGREQGGGERAGGPAAEHGGPS